MSRCCFAAMALACFLFAGVAVCAEEVTLEQLVKHVQALASDSAAERDRAEAALLAGGKAAVELLGPAAMRGALEERFRATRILGRLANSESDAAASARDALRAIAAQGDGPVSKQAKDELATWLRLEEMQKLAAAFPLDRLADPDKPERLAVSKEPLLRFLDNERTVFDGTLWAYGTPGRPAAFISIYSYIGAAGELAWNSDIVSVSPRPLRAESVDKVPGQNWTPSASATTQPFPGARAPEADGEARLAQAIELAHRLKAREAWPPGAPPIDLALTPKPLLRYSDQEVADGFVFAYMHETNPEIIVLLEARKKDDKLVWHYEFGRQGAAALWIDLDGREVFSGPSPADYVSGGDMPYWHFRRAGP
jgi:hypothetical protein